MAWRKPLLQDPEACEALVEALVGGVRVMEALLGARCPTALPAEVELLKPQGSWRKQEGR